MIISNYDINTFRWLSKIARDKFNIHPEGLRLQTDIYDNIEDIIYKILIVEDDEWFIITSGTNLKDVLIDFSDLLLE